MESDRGTRLYQSLARLSRIPVASLISLGAGSGGDSVFVASRWPGARLLMIEANPEHEPALRAASKAEFVDYVICAAGRDDGVVPFDASSPSGGAIVASGGAERPARSVDSLVAERRLPPPYFLKFDTHGAELDILEGAGQTLAQTSLIMMEVYNFRLNYASRPMRFHEMCAHLETLGFRCIDLCDPLYRPRDGALWQMHLFFTRDDDPAFSSNSYRGG